MKKNLIKIIACIFIITFFLKNQFIRFVDVMNVSKMNLVYDLCWQIPMLLLLCIVVIRFDKVLVAKKSKVKLQGIWYGVYFAVFYSLFYTPIANADSPIDEFVRIIGQGVINDYDCTKVIHNFMMWFVWFAIYFVLFTLFFHYLKSMEVCEENKKVLRFLDKIVVIGVIDLALQCIEFFNNSETIYDLSSYTSYLIFVVLGLGIIYLCMGFHKRLNASLYYKIMFFIFLFSFLATTLLAGTSGFWRAFICIYAVLNFCMLAFMWFKKDIWNHSLVNHVIQYGVLILSLLPFVLSLYIELINILNQYGVFVGEPLFCWFLIAVMAVLGVLLLSVFGNRNQWKLAKWKKWSYPWLVFGVSCLSVQIPLEGVYEVDIFESANYSILISDFFNFGSIPLVEHYGGHMMNSVWEGVLYGLINNDTTGAIFSPYSDYLIPMLAVLFFYLVKTIWDEDAALWTTLAIPFMGNWSFYGLGMLIIVAMIAYVRKETYKRAFLFWLAFVWCALYRLDLGIAFGVAAILAIGVYIVIFKRYKAIRHLLISFLTIMVAGCGLWGVLCIWKGINPLTRLLEFIEIGLSNLNWGYSSIGATNKMAFSFCYIFIPFMMLASDIYIILHKAFREKVGKNVWLILLVFGFSYFANFSRGLVRHSLFEGTTMYSLWCALIFIAIFVACIWDNIKLFVPIFMLLILCNSLMMTGENYKEQSLVGLAVMNAGENVNSWTATTEVNAQGEPITYWEKIKEEQRTVIRAKALDEDMVRITPYETVLNILLEDDETYVDFVNRSFIYSAIGRKCPVYVSQSPLQLSGEFTQEEFAKQIESNKEKIPLVIMPMVNNQFSAMLDGIPNVYRYYHVAEYIYQNYVPLCSADEFAVWCAPERYEEMLQKINEVKIIDANSIYMLIDYGYDGPAEEINEDGNAKIVYRDYLHSYSLGKLPYIWANYDEEDAASNKVLSVASQTEEYFVMNQLDSDLKGKGNYLLLSSEYKGNVEKGTDETVHVTLKLGIYQNGEFVEKYKYDFTAQEGNNDYIFRVSSDYYWYAENINAVQIEGDAELYDIELKVLEGD